MKIWITLPYDPDGLEEVECDDKPSNALITVRSGALVTHYQYWLEEGVTWHRTKAKAVAAAKIHRANWIAETAMKAAKVAALAAIAA